MNVSEKLFARQIITAAEQVGAELPDDVIEGFERADRVSRASRGLGVGDQAVAVAVCDALADDRDPGADPAVTRALQLTAIANEGVAAAIDGIMFDRFRAVCRDQADDIVGAFSEVFDQAAAVLVDAYKLIGDLDLGDTTAILGQGTDAAAVWAPAQAADRTIVAVDNGWRSLAEFTRLAAPTPRYAALRLTDLTYPEYLSTDPRLSPWDIVRAGHRLDLPTMTGYRARVAAIEEEARQLELAEKEAAHDRMSGRDRTWTRVSRAGQLA